MNAADTAELARNALFNFPELFPVANVPGPSFQLHWQNPMDFTQTEFVGQSPQVQSFEEVEAWLNELVERRRSECPEGWCPMVCNEESEHFVRAAAQSA